ncbi:hypothetical protein [Thalassotalea castellviae]|uniref:Anti-sigma factor n=1 Tax=Thalassotalea castellviae TaxID=3075612 RepID=A0ABU3A0A5_9GAMM|nr:hypothetical protein [Thalassotalea sp. W431]MDT0603389.1 hypothetical protein [Thalassotalea sp. W431]
MSEIKDTDLEQNFAQWLARKTSDKNKQIDDVEFEQDSQWHDRMATVNKLAHYVDIANEHNVPHWDRGSTFTSDKKPWWQWSALPAMSFAFSCFAIALVLLKVELIVKPEGVMLSFADNYQASHQASQDERIAQLVDQKLQAFASEQQVILANYAADIKVKQQESNLQLASYVIGASRQERKEDLSDFIKYINEQRADEQFQQKMKFKELEQTINYRTTQLDKRLDRNLSNLGLQPTPADWTTEE